MELTLESGKPARVAQVLLSLRQGSEPLLLVRLADRTTGAGQLLELAVRGRPATLRSAEGELAVRIRGGDPQRRQWTVGLLANEPVARLEATSEVWRVFQKRAGSGHDFLRLLLGDSLQNAVDGSWLDEALAEGVCILRPPGLTVGGHAARLAAQLAGAVPRVGPLRVWNDANRPLEIVDLEFAGHHPCRLPPGGYFRGDLGTGWSWETAGLTCTFGIQVGAEHRLELIRGLTEKGPELPAPLAEPLKNWRPGALLDGTRLLCRELMIDLGGLAAERDCARVQAVFGPWPAPAAGEAVRVKLAARVAQWCEEDDHWLESNPAIFSAGPALRWQVGVFDGEGQLVGDARLRALVVVPSSRRDGQEGLYCRRQEGDEVLVEVADLEAPVVLGGLQAHQRTFEERGWDLAIHAARLALITGGLEEGSNNTIVSSGAEELRVGAPGKVVIEATGETTLTTDSLVVRASRETVLDSGRMAVKAALSVAGEAVLGKTLVVTGHGAFKEDAEIAGNLQVGAARGVGGGPVALTAESLESTLAQSEREAQRAIEQAGHGIRSAARTLGAVVAAATAPLERAAVEAMAQARQVVAEAQGRLEEQIDQASIELQQAFSGARKSLEEASGTFASAAIDVQSAVIAVTDDRRRIPAAAWSDLRTRAADCIETARNLGAAAWREVKEKAEETSRRTADALATARNDAAHAIASAGECASQAWEKRGELLRDSLGHELSSVDRAVATVSRTVARFESLEKTLVAAGQHLASEAGCSSAEIEAAVNRVVAEGERHWQRCATRLRNEGERIAGQLKKFREQTSQAVGPAGAADFERSLAMLSNVPSARLEAVPQALRGLARGVEEGLAEAARALSEVELADVAAGASETITNAQTGDREAEVLGRLEGELREADRELGRRLEPARQSLVAAGESIRGLSQELACQTARLPQAAAALSQEVAALADRVGAMPIVKDNVSQEAGELLVESRLTLARLETEIRSGSLEALERLAQASREGQLVAARAERRIEEALSRFGPPPTELTDRLPLGHRSPLIEAQRELEERALSARHQLNELAQASLATLNQSAAVLVEMFRTQSALPGVPLEQPSGLKGLQDRYRSLAKRVAASAQVALGKIEAAGRLHQVDNKARLEEIGEKARRLADELAGRERR